MKKQRNAYMTMPMASLYNFTRSKEKQECNVLSTLHAILLFFCFILLCLSHFDSGRFISSITCSLNVMKRYSRLHSLLYFCNFGVSCYLSQVRIIHFCYHSQDTYGNRYCSNLEAPRFAIFCLNILVFGRSSHVHLCLLGQSYQ